MSLIDSPFLVEPGKKFKLSDHKADDTGKFSEKDDAEPRTLKNLEELEKLQDKLYAQAEIRGADRIAGNGRRREGRHDHQGLQRRQSAGVRRSQLQVARRRWNWRTIICGESTPPPRRRG